MAVRQMRGTWIRLTTVFGGVPAGGFVQAPGALAIALGLETAARVAGSARAALRTVTHRRGPVPAPPPGAADGHSRPGPGISGLILAVGLVVSSAACSGGGAGASAAVIGAASSVAPGAPTLRVTASSRSGFDQSSLDAPANTAFAVSFNNADAGVPHDVAIKDASGSLRFQGQVITGPQRATYDIAGLPSGTYTFFCAVHPNMQGTLVVH